MREPKTRVVVWRFDAARDTESLRECVIDQQNFHRGIETSWPDGDAIVGDYLAYLDAECAAHDGCIIMAYCGGQAVGFVCVVATTHGESPEDPASFAWVHDIYVKSAFRRRGVASMLMAEAERFARSEGAQVLRLGVLDGNDRARRFYVRHGFRDYTHVLTKPLELRRATFVPHTINKVRFSLEHWAFVPLRLIVGYGFMAHGYAKIARGPVFFIDTLHALGVPWPAIMGWATILIELVGGLAVLIGALIPLVSVPLAAILLVAMVTVHLPYGFSSIKLQSVTKDGPQFGKPGYETNLLYLAGLAALVLGGPGPLALHGLRARATGKRPGDHD